MSKPKLVLSNTTTFFSGRIEKVFKKAKKNGFKYLEILPYRWVTPEQILRLEQKYQVEVIGIHMPEWWSHSLFNEIKLRPGIVQKILAFVWFFYIGIGKSNPGIKILDALKQKGKNPYLLLHSNLALEMSEETLIDFINKYNVVVENISIQEGVQKELWDPNSITTFLKKYTEKKSLVFDHGHLEESRKIKSEIDPINLYKENIPDILHIGYNDYKPIYHSLPNKQNQEKLSKMLSFHQPEYIVIETNPLVSIKKAKLLIEKLMTEAKNNTA